MKIGKKVFGILLIITTIVVSAFFIPWSLLIMKISPLQDTIQEDLDLVTSKHSIDGVIVYIDQNGAVSMYASGYNDRDAKIEASPDDLFKIASISKLYMAVAATMLIENNTLDADETLANMLPQYENSIENADAITLRMLIQHRSGISNFVDDPDFPWENLPTNVDDVLNLVLGDKADFEPDAKYQYSNTNYLLLAKIMDKALGYPHDIYIKENILNPLNLNNTFYYYDEVDPSRVMSGYFVGYEYDLKPNDHITPGGTMIASIEDVGIFIRALNDGSLLTDTQQTLYSELYAYEHTGLLPGYQSIARYNKEEDRVIIVFTNTSGEDSWGRIETIYNRVERITNK